MLYCHGPGVGLTRGKEGVQLAMVGFGGMGFGGCGCGGCGFSGCGGMGFGGMGFNPMYNWPQGYRLLPWMFGRAPWMC